MLCSISQPRGVAISSPGMHMSNAFMTGAISPADAPGGPQGLGNFAASSSAQQPESYGALPHPGSQPQVSMPAPPGLMTFSQ
eukprot:scaffold38638_cov42-Prasinocladus_malaysianus.AAC.1